MASRNPPVRWLVTGTRAILVLWTVVFIGLNLWPGGYEFVITNLGISARHEYHALGWPATYFIQWTSTPDLGIEEGFHERRFRVSAIAANIVLWFSTCGLIWTFAGFVRRRQFSLRELGFFTLCLALLFAAIVHIKSSSLEIGPGPFSPVAVEE
jgi:hypothetical protein